MNILILSWRGPGHPNAGGAEAMVHEHARYWTRLGHKITLFTSSYVNAKNEENIDGITILRKGNQLLTVQILAFFWFIFKRNQFDLVVDNFHGIPFFTPLYTRKRVLCIVHEIAGSDVWKLNPLPYPFNKIAALVGPQVEKFTFNKIYKDTYFMTVSDSTREELVSCGISKRKISVIKNGFIPNRSNNVYKKVNRKTAMFLGALSKDKGIENALEIFSQIERKDDSWQFWVAGKGDADYLKCLKNMAKNLEIFPKVKFFGYVSERKKYELLSKAHVLINSSIKEGWGLVNIEANSVGTPVIGYDVEGTRDSIANGKTGILVKKEDNITAAKQAIILVNTPEIYKNYQKEAINWSKQHTWQKSTKKSLALIESL